MTDLREKLAFIMWKNDAERAAPNVAKRRTESAFQEQNNDAMARWLIFADAIIAALPGMVKPLEWKTQKYWSPEQIGHHAAPYSIYENPENGACVITSGSPYFFGPEHTSDVEAAKAIANAHHRAAIMAALGVEGE